jgi:ATP-dependent DNA helicase RecQ
LVYGHSVLIIKELGKLFTNFGVIKIAPMVIARTVGGDIM